MKSVALILILLGTAMAAAAHPGVGIVIDSRGNVFYTDLKQVWMQAPDGSKKVVVPGVHTHELSIDANDQLYGEHLWYEGERIDKWGHYVWRRSPDGKVEKIIPPREGFLQNYSFVRDRAGNMYWVDRDKSVIRKRTPHGRVVEHARVRLRDARWMTSTPDGVLFLADYHDLLRIAADGKSTRIARNLSERSVKSPFAGGRHALMGIWADRAGYAYVACNAEGVVKRVTPKGLVSIVTRSPFLWSPTGGVFAPNGELWILEYSVSNEARVRRVRTFTSGKAVFSLPDGKSQELVVEAGKAIFVKATTHATDHPDEAHVLMVELKKPMKKMK